jgi:hypothetical protein
MAKTQVGGLRTVGSREAAEAGVEADLSVPAQLNSKSKYVYQSRKQAFVLSLARRRVHWDPQTGFKEEETPMSAAGNRLDMIRFTDHFFRHDDDEIDALMVAMGKKHPEVFGIDGLCWRYEDKQAEMRAARAVEIRSVLASDPALAREVALTPSDKKDWDVQPKTPAVSQPRAQASVEDMTPEELEAATAPVPGSRAR